MNRGMYPYDTEISERLPPAACKDCINTKCIHRGKVDECCPMYRCNRPDVWRFHCDTCIYADD